MQRFLTSFKGNVWVTKYFAITGHLDSARSELLGTESCVITRPVHFAGFSKLRSRRVLQILVGGELQSFFSVWFLLLFKFYNPLDSGLEFTRLQLQISKYFLKHLLVHQLMAT